MLSKTIMCSHHSVFACVCARVSGHDGIETSAFALKPRGIPFSAVLEPPPEAARCFHSVNARYLRRVVTRGATTFTLLENWTRENSTGGSLLTGWCSPITTIWLEGFYPGTSVSHVFKGQDMSVVTLYMADSSVSKPEPSAGGFSKLRASTTPPRSDLETAAFRNVRQ